MVEVQGYQAVQSARNAVEGFVPCVATATSFNASHDRLEILALDGVDCAETAHLGACVLKFAKDTFCTKRDKVNFIYLFTTNI